MRIVVAYVLGLGLAAPAVATELPPSGVQIDLHEALFEPVGVTAATARTLRLRYLAPAISDPETVGFDTIEADFEWLCARDGLDFRAQSAPMVERIIVSIASAPVVFGETAPNVVQYFDAFRVENAACIWEGL